ncbi:MAG TPA: hypothetical protein VGG27_01450 [Magnetospirillaceae bacterium]|jgi:hypothetical protein
MARLVFAGPVILLLTPVAALAAQQQVTDSASYIIGENDTRADAVAACVARIERKALEDSGTLIESQLDVVSTEKDGAVTDSAKRRVQSYVAAMVKATNVHTKLRAEKDGFAIDCTAKVTFDPDAVTAQMKAAHNDEATKREVEAAKTEVDEQQTKLAALETEVQDLRSAVSQRQQQQRQASAASAMQARNLQVGMTTTEVIGYAGNPPKVVHEYAGVMGIDSWDYGSTWVTVRGGLVQCISTAQNPICAPDNRIR